MGLLDKLIKKSIKENWENDNDLVKNLILNATDWDDFLQAVETKYGKIIPIYHATTIEKSKIIDREGFKLVQGKNYTSFSKEKNLYFQLGKSDYVSSNRPIVYKFQLPVSFLNYCDIDMDSVSISDSTLSKYINLDIFDEMESDIKDVIQYFIWNKLKLDGFELILQERYVDNNIKSILNNPKIVSTENKLNESTKGDDTISLYHGTCLSNAENLIRNGWRPINKSSGNMGNPNYLYLTSEPEDALWFAEENGCDAVVIVKNIPISFLKPDPEDEAGFSMADLFTRMDTSGYKLPSKFILTKKLNSEHFEF